MRSRWCKEILQSVPHDCFCWNGGYWLVYGGAWFKRLEVNISRWTKIPLWGIETMASKSVESTEKAFLHETKQFIHVFILQSSRQWGCFYEDGSFRNLHDCRRRKEHSVKRFTVNHHIFSTEKFKLHNVPRDLEKQNFSWRSLVSQTYRTRSNPKCFLWFGFSVIFSLFLNPGEK